MCARKMRLLYMFPICSNSVPILHRTACPPPPPPPPSQRDATPRTNTAAGYITAGYITDPDTHREQRGPLSDFWVPGRLPGGSREAKEGAAPCAPCRNPCTSGRPPRAPTHGLMSTGASQGFRGRPGVQGGRPGAQGPARGPGWPARGSEIQGGSLEIPGRPHMPWLQGNKLGICVLYFDHFGRLFT